MGSKLFWIGGAAAALVSVGWYMFKGTDGGSEIEYKYAPVTVGNLAMSTSSTGVLVPLTQVDVKSKAGGIVFEILVEEGAIVKQGDLIARIDPRDTRSVFEQAQADSTSASIRVQQAKITAELEERNAANRVKDAELALERARLQLESAEENADVQPTLTSANIESAKANLEAQEQTMNRLKQVEIPQRRRDAKNAVTRTQTDLVTAEANKDRQERLFAEGYVSKAVVEQAASSFESSKSAYESAAQRFATLDQEISADLRAQEARVEQSKAALNQANANSIQVDQSQRDLKTAVQSYEQAKITLQEAKDAALTVKNRKNEINAAEASAVRSSVAMQNAREQLDQTSVTAPRDGIVTLKYIEEGTIIPPGTSTFAQGTSIVQISDTTRMFIECQVDEADIADVYLGQKVNTIIEAYPRVPFQGEVTRIYPAAETDGALTSIKVRIELQLKSDEESDQYPLRVGMNADCEFILLEKKDVLIVPMQAVKFDRETRSRYVLVKSDDPLNPARKEIKIGDEGNEGIEVIEGLSEGDEVVIAEIDLAAMRDRQQKMQESEEGGGLTGGSRRR